jgi:hypothetical protein
MTTTEPEPTRAVELEISGMTWRLWAGRPVGRWAAVASPGTVASAARCGAASTSSSSRGR